MTYEYSSCEESRQLSRGALNVALERAERRRIRLAACPDHKIDRRGRRQEARAHQFAQAALQSIAVDRRLRVTRYDQADAGVIERGSDGPNVQVRGSDSLPLSRNTLKLCPARQSMAPRKT